MGLLQLYGKNFFEELPPGTKGPQLGQVTWCVVPQLLPHPHVIEAVRQDARSHETANARFVVMDDRHFTRRDHKELPILNLRLGETEEVVAFKAKRRPGVVVATNATHVGDQKKQHHEERRCAVAPVFGLQTEDDPNGFSGIMATRVRHLLYRQYFPFGEWTERRPHHEHPGACSLTDGIIRLDRLQFVTPSAPACQPVPLRLADEPLKLLQAWLWAYFHGPSDSKVWTLLQELLELFGEAIPEDAKPKAAR